MGFWGKNFSIIKIQTKFMDKIAQHCISFYMFMNHYHLQGCSADFLLFHDKIDLLISR